VGGGTTVALGGGGGGDGGVGGGTSVMFGGADNLPENVDDVIGLLLIAWYRNPDRTQLALLNRFHTSNKTYRLLEVALERQLVQVAPERQLLLADK
jgi:hypothetical protein